MTALAEIDAVGVLHEDFLVFIAVQAMVFVALLVDRRVVGAKIYVSEIAVSAVDEVESPPTLILAGDPRDLEALNVGKEDQIVIPDRGHTIARMIALGKTVVFAAVEDRLAATDDVDVSVSALDSSAEVGAVMLVDEHLGKRAVRHSKMAVLQDQGEVRWQTDRVIDLEIAADGGCSGSVFYRFVYFGLDVLAAVWEEVFH